MLGGKARKSGSCLGLSRLDCQQWNGISGLDTANRGEGALVPPGGTSGSQVWCSSQTWLSLSLTKPSLEPNRTRSQDGPKYLNVNSTPVCSPRLCAITTLYSSPRWSNSLSRSSVKVMRPLGSASSAINPNLRRSKATHV